MTRRFERDRARIEAYFEDLHGELDRRARKSKLEPQVVADKQRAVRAEREAKLEALERLDFSCPCMYVCMHGYQDDLDRS